MSISVGIPTCNRLNLLIDALNSCLHQTYPPSEIIIGDDSTTDDSKNYIENFISNNKYNIEVKYFKNFPALGQGENVNKIIENISYKKFLLLHDDDILELNTLHLLNEEFIKKNGENIVYGKQFIIDHSGALFLLESEKHNKQNLRTEYYTLNPLTSVNAALVQQLPNDGFLIDANCFKSVPYYLSSRKDFVDSAVDFDFGLRLAMAGFSYSFINTYVSNYRLTKVSISNSHCNKAALMAFNIILNLPHNLEYEQKFRADRLTNLAPAALSQAIKSRQLQMAVKIYFGKWHRTKIITLGGGKRTMLLLSSFLKKFLQKVF